MSRQAFINQVKDGAVAGWEKYKVLPSISIAQAALESGWGGSALAKSPNFNLFGIKSSADWNGPSVNYRTQEWSASKGYYYVYADFRVYDSWAHSIEEHGAFFTNTEWRKNNYRKVIGEKNYKTAAQELKNVGYATDPDYPSKLIRIIEQYNLQEWDQIAFDGGNGSNATPPPQVSSPGAGTVTSSTPGAANIAAMSYDDDILVSPTGESVIYNKNLNDQFGFRPKKGQVMWIERILKVNTDDPKEILAEGLRYMREHAYPSAQYIVKLKELPDTVSIGDTGIFIDHEFNPPLAIEARILDITTSETVENNNTVTIGNVTELFPQDKEDILALQRQLQETRDGLLDEFHRGAPLQIVIEGSNGLILSGNRSDFETELIQGTTTDRSVPEGEHVIELYSAKKTDNNFRLSGKLANNIISHVDDLIIGDVVTAEETIVPEPGQNPQGEDAPYRLEPQDTHELDITEFRVDFLDGLGQTVLEETIPLYHDAEFTFPIEDFNKNIRKIKIYAPKDLTFERISFTEREADRAKISSTQLVARVYQGNHEVTERFNNFSWVRVSESFRADEGWNDAKKFIQANHVTVYADDIEQEESTFVCRLFDNDFQEVLVSSAAVVKIGAEGKSAYQVAVENGFEGTLDEWVSSLRGSDGSNGIPGEPGEDGQSTYIHVAWADSPMGDGFSTSDSVGKEYMGTYVDEIEADSQNYLDYQWMRVKGEKGDPGEQGPRGIPGDKGDDGQSQYVHIRYSVNSNGSDMTTTPSSTTKYVGIAVTNSDKAPSFPEFTWSKYVGEDGDEGPRGLPGKNGVDGTTTYTWVRYADTPTSGMENFPDGKKYIGLAFNQTTQDESNDYEDYQWSLMPQNIEIGGRNYAKGTSREFTHVTVGTYSGSLTDGGTTSQSVYTLEELGAQAGDTITVSMYVGESEGGYGGGFRIDDQGGHNKYSTQNVVKNGYVSETFTILAGTTEIRLYTVGYGQSGASGGFDLPVKELKLEKGNTATDWTPAPEDIQSQIDDKASAGDLDETVRTIETESEKIASLRTDVDITKNNMLITHTDEYVNKIITTESKADDLEGRVVSVEETKENVDTFFQFDDAFTIGKSNAQTKLRMTNDEIQFLDGETKGTYITGNTMVSQNIAIQDKLNLTKHTIETEGDVTVIRFTG